MDNQQVKQLFQKYLNGQCTAEETAWVESWYLRQSTAFQRPDAEMIDRNEELMLNFLESRMTPKKMVSLWPKIAVAAAITCILFGAYLFRASFTNTDTDNTALVATDIAPGKNGATLTLANGQKIFINDALAGNIANQSGVKISKSKDGQIIYEVSDQGTGKIEYNTLTTTRGEQTQVRLPDGSVVFLNAASSLRYPTSFAKAAKRSVGLRGEGYFEISKNKAQPFVVTAAGQQVEVLGTHFNINAYADEKAVRTTLLEGSVKVVPVSAEGSGAFGSQGKVLKPGQQSVFTEQGIQLNEVNLDQVMAWQKGYFRFYDEQIASVMRKVSRWYNVEVEYAGQQPEVGFNARIDKYSNIRDVLGILEKSGAVHFKIEGRKVIVSK